MPYKVLCDGDLIVLNDQAILPTLEDAKCRVPFYAGRHLAEMHKDGSRLPKIPKEEDWSKYKEEPDGCLRLTILGFTFLIVPC